MSHRPCHGSVLDIVMEELKVYYITIDYPGIYRLLRSLGKAEENFDMVDSIQSQHVVLHEEGASRTYEQELIGEEPLLILIEGQPYAVVMRTPGEEICHVAGFCLGEGLVDDFEDFSMLNYKDQTGSNTVAVKLKSERRKKVAGLLKKSGLIRRTGSGICGKEMIKDLNKILAPITDETRISRTQAISCLDQLARHQDFYKRTSASHGVMLFDSILDVLSVAEDVGRHNAFDKAIGKVFMSGQLKKARLAVLSSRISYELVKKAARSSLSIVVSMSRPTDLAVELGRSLNMTLACMEKESGLMVFCGEERFTK